MVNPTSFALSYVEKQNGWLAWHGAAAVAMNDLTAEAQGAAMNLRAQAGVVGDGTADDAAALNTAFASAASLGVRVFASGTFKIGSTVTITSDADLSGATFNWAGPSSTVAVQVGSSTSGTRTFNKVIHLPKVINTLKVGTGWAQTGVVGSTGVKCYNLDKCNVTFMVIKGFATGLHCTGKGQGHAYTTINMGHLDNNKVSHLVDADATGWCNSNTFIGGKWSMNSGEGTAVSGSKFIHIPVTTNDVNTNTWLNATMEAEGAEYFLHCSGMTNTWAFCRWEHDTGAPVHWGAGARLNVILFGYSTHTIDLTHDAAEGVDNKVIPVASWSTSSATASNLNELVAQNIDPLLMSGAGAAMVSGTVYVIKLTALTSDPITNLLVYVNTAGSTLTSGQCFAAVYDAAGDQLGITATQHTAWESTGIKTMALVSPTTTRIPGETLYVALLANGTTGPALRATSSGSPNIGLTAALGYRCATQGTSQTALPSTVVPSSSTGQSTHQPFVGAN